MNAALAILGFFSLCTAAFNLLPIRPLDASIAWGLLPALFKRRPTRMPSADRPISIANGCGRYSGSIFDKRSRSSAM